MRKTTEASESRIRPNGYLTPNIYVDRLLYLLTGDEWKVLSYALRRIYGFNKRQDQIALTQFDHGTLSREGEALDHGTGLRHEANVRALAALATFNILIVVSKGTPDRAGKPGQSTVYAINEDDETIDWVQLDARREATRIQGLEKLMKANAAQAEKRERARREDAPDNAQPGPSHGPGPGPSHGPGPGPSHGLNNIQGNTGKDSEGIDNQNPPADTGESAATQPAASAAAPIQEKKKRKSKADPRTSSPAIQLIHAVTGRRPNKGAYDVLIERLGPEPDGERFAHAYAAWCMAGFREDNIGGVLDWYENGIPDMSKPRAGRTNQPQTTYTYPDANGNLVTVEFAFS